MDELKAQLEGQREGLEFALEALDAQKEIIKNTIKILDLQLAEIKEKK